MFTTVLIKSDLRRQKANAESCLSSVRGTYFCSNVIRHLIGDAKLTHPIVSDYRDNLLSGQRALKCAPSKVKKREDFYCIHCSHVYVVVIDVEVRVEDVGVFHRCDT